MLFALYTITVLANNCLSYCKAYRRLWSPQKQGRGGGGVGGGGAEIFSRSCTWSYRYSEGLLFSCFERLPSVAHAT